jgi:soluble lytic murein transglycosylase-like protein
MAVAPLPVAGDAANMFVSTAYSTAHEIKLDPLLILAVMAIESGLNPVRGKPDGRPGPDAGHVQGPQRQVR